MTEALKLKMLNTVQCKFSLVNFNSNFNESLTGYTGNLKQFEIAYKSLTADTEPMMFTILQSLIEPVVEFLADSCEKLKKLLETWFKPSLKPKNDDSFETSDALILLIVICVQIQNQSNSKTLHTQPHSCKAKLPFGV